MNWKESGQKWSWPNLHFPGIVLEELKKKARTSVVIFGSSVVKGYKCARNFGWKT
jgi:hypothetical protein